MGKKYMKEVSKEWVEKNKAVLCTHCFEYVPEVEFNESHKFAKPILMNPITQKKKEII